MNEEIGFEEDSEMHEPEASEKSKTEPLSHLDETLIMMSGKPRGSMLQGDEKFLDIDWPQFDENGEEVLMRITVPIIRVKKKREFKKIIRKRVVEIPQDYESLTDEGGEGEEYHLKEDVIQHYETMVVMETVTKTVLVKTKNEDGEIEEVEFDVIEEFVISDDPSKFKVVIVKKVQSDGEEVLEEHITPEMSVHEPYEAAESIEEYGEALEEEASTIDELRVMAELEEEEEEEELDISFAELEEEEESEEEVEELKEKKVSDEEEEEEHDFSEYSEEEIKIIPQEEQAKWTQEVSGEEEEELESEEELQEKGEEEVLVARFPKDYGRPDDVEEEETVKRQLKSESTVESEDESVEEDMEQEVAKKEPVEAEEDKGKGQREKKEEEELGEEEEGEDIYFEGLEEEEVAEEEESEVEESDRYWWRTSGIDVDDFELPDDPIKANRILQAELWRQTKLRDKYTKQIEHYFREHKEEISYMPPYLEVSELQKYYKRELKELKQIIDTFSDSYDDFNYKMRFIRKRNKKSDKIFYFFMDALKKTLLDIAKRTDKKTLAKITKGRTLEEMISEIFRLEDNLSFAYIRKAIYTLELEEMKLMVRGGDTDQSHVPPKNRTVDLLLLSDLQSKCHHSADLKEAQLQETNLLKDKFNSTIKDFCFKRHEVSYHETLKRHNLKDLTTKLKKSYESRQREFKKVLDRLEAHKKKENLHTITRKRLQNVSQYITMKNK